MTSSDEVSMSFRIRFLHCRQPTFTRAKREAGVWLTPPSISSFIGSTVGWSTHTLTLLSFSIAKQFLKSIIQTYQGKVLSMGKSIFIEIDSLALGHKDLMALWSRWVYYLIAFCGGSNRHIRRHVARAYRQQIVIKCSSGRKEEKLSWKHRRHLGLAIGLRCCPPNPPATDRSSPATSPQR